jgi:hypothetical protein
MKAVGGTLQKKGGTAISALVSIRSKFNALDALLVGECSAPGVAEALRALALDYLARAASQKQQQTQRLSR